MPNDAPDDSVRRSWLYHPEFHPEWSRQPLYPLARWVNGLAFRDITFTDCGLPVIKIAEIKGGISGQTKFTTQVFDEAVRVRQGDMLFSWSGQPETSIDVFWWRGREGWLNQHVFRVTPAECVDRTFFYYLLRYLRPHFVAIARNKQTTGLGHVTKRDIERMEVALPAAREQAAIASVLGALDDRIELCVRLRRTLEDVARAVFTSWFVDFDPVRRKATGEPTALPVDVAGLFSDRLVDSPVGEVPEGWRVIPLPEAFEVNPTRTLRKGEVAPYLDMSNMPTQGHAPAQWVQREVGSGMRFKNGDTLVARITPCLENGKTAFVDFLDNGAAAWGSTEYIVLRPRAPLPPVFAYLLARSDRFRTFAIQAMTGSSGRQRVPADSLAHFLIAVPPDADDRIATRFGTVVEPLFARMSTAMNQSRTLAALRDALLPKLISGELRIADAEHIVGRAV